MEQLLEIIYQRFKSGDLKAGEDLLQYVPGSYEDGRISRCEVAKNSIRGHFYSNRYLSE